MGPRATRKAPQEGHSRSGEGGDSRGTWVLGPKSPKTPWFCPLAMKRPRQSEQQANFFLPQKTGVPSFLRETPSLTETEHLDSVFVSKTVSTEPRRTGRLCVCVCVGGSARLQCLPAGVRGQKVPEPRHLPGSHTHRPPRRAHAKPSADVIFSKTQPPPPRDPGSAPHQPEGPGVLSGKTSRPPQQPIARTQADLGMNWVCSGQGLPAAGARA